MTSIPLITLYASAFFSGYQLVASLGETRHRTNVSSSLDREHEPIFIGNTSSVSRQNFGIISWKENTVTRKCDGVVIGPNHVLTVYECTPDYENGNLITNYIFKVGVLNLPVSGVYVIPGNRFLLVHLRHTIKTLQPYAMLSWFGEPQSDASYNIKQELISAHPFLLSDTSGKLPDSHGCLFVDGVPRQITLSCPAAYSRQMGVAIYKRMPHSQNNVVVGLVREKIPEGERLLLRGWKITEKDIQDIMSVAMAIGSGPPQDTDYIPTGTTSKQFQITY